MRAVIASYCFGKPLKPPKDKMHRELFLPCFGMKSYTADPTDSGPCRRVHRDRSASGAKQGADARR